MTAVGPLTHRLWASRGDAGDGQRMLDVGVEDADLGNEPPQIPLPWASPIWSWDCGASLAPGRVHALLHWTLLPAICYNSEAGDVTP